MNTVWPSSHLTNLRFADDVLLCATTLPQLASMLEDLAEEAKEVGLGLHFGKTKILGSMQVRRGVSAAKHVLVQGHNVEVLPHEASVAYLGRAVSFEGHHDVELRNRLTKAWAKFATHKNELCSRHYSLHDRLKLFGAVITPSVLYGCGTWVMTAERERSLRTTERKMLRRMVGARRRKGAQEEDSPGDGSPSNRSSSSSSSSSSEGSTDGSATDNTGVAPQAEKEEDEEEEEEESWEEWIVRATNIAVGAAKKAGVVDWVEEQRRRKWRWAGHVARRRDGRWSSRLLNWEPQEGRRAWGRPAMRWEDALCKFIRSKGESWQLAARDREKWCSWEDEFAEQRW